MEKRLLQSIVAVACLVPLAAGGAGMVMGPRMMGVAPSAGDLDSHFRYLSGLLFAIGIGFLSTIPRIDVQGPRFRLLAAVVTVGGLGRLLSVIVVGSPSPSTLFALAMELVVTPGLALWQMRISHLPADAPPGSPSSG